MCIYLLIYIQSCALRNPVVRTLVPYPVTYIAYIHVYIDIDIHVYNIYMYIHIYIYTNLNLCPEEYHWW